MRLLAVIASVVACANLAYAGDKWPRPAAGASASGSPELILTFDDGPHEVYTPRILAELDRRGLKATFFWVGHRIISSRRNVDKRRDIARRAVRDGHLVGNHTINHAQLCTGPREIAEWEIDENERLWRELLGMPLRWFRAPYGASCDRVKDMLGERGLTHLHWDMDPHEWEHHDLDMTVEYVQRKLRSLKGRGVLLLHDTKAVTVRALPIILDWIDDENERRIERGDLPIKIVSYVELAREQLAPGMDELLDSARADLLGFAGTIGSLIPGSDDATPGRTPEPPAAAGKQALLTPSR